MKTTKEERAAVQKYLRAKHHDHGYAARDVLRFLDDLDTLEAALETMRNGERVARAEREALREVEAAARRWLHSHDGIDGGLREAAQALFDALAKVPQ